MFLSLFFSYLISCCFSEHTVISAVLQTYSTFAAFIPLFMCFCHQECQPSQEKTSSVKILFFLSCQYQEVSSSQTDLDASHLSVCSPLPFLQPFRLYLGVQV